MLGLSPAPPVCIIFLSAALLSDNGACFKSGLAPAREACTGRTDRLPLPLCGTQTLV